MDIEASDVYQHLELERGKYILLSAHREVNLDTKKEFHFTFQRDNKMAEKYDMTLLYSNHSRSSNRLAVGVIHAVDSATTDCQPNENVEALRVFMLEKKVEARPVWKPMHKQPVYKNAPAYVNGVSEAIFKVGMCLPAGPYVTDDDVRYIVDCIKEAIVR